MAETIIVNGKEKTICGAKSRQGRPCRQPPMENGRCKFHGGMTPRGIASPHYQHGRYSKYMPQRLMARYEEALQNPELLALNSEIGLAQSRVTDLLQRVDTGEAGKVWGKAKDTVDELKYAINKGDRKRSNDLVKDLILIIEQGYTDYAAWGEIFDALERIRKLAETERRRREAMQNFITAEQAMMLLTGMVEAVRENVDDQRSLQRIQEAFVRLTQGNGSDIAFD